MKVKLNWTRGLFFIFHPKDKVKVIIILESSWKTNSLALSRILEFGNWRWKLKDMPLNNHACQLSCLIIHQNSKILKLLSKISVSLATFKLFSLSICRLQFFLNFPILLASTIFPGQVATKNIFLNIT